jgi:Cu2+-exporting ATPase
MFTLIGIGSEGFLFSLFGLFFPEYFPNDSKLKANGTSILKQQRYTNLGLVRSVVRSQSAQQNQWCHKKLLKLAPTVYLSH